MTGNWAATVTIQADVARETFSRITGTRDAAHYLLDQWTRGRTESYCAAIRMCAKAIKGEASHEAAYVAFMAAAEEAKVAVVSSRIYAPGDQFESDISQVLAESMLAELRAMWTKA